MTGKREDWRLRSGYWPGVLAEVVRLHMDYYGRAWNFGLMFETKVAAELAGVLRRFQPESDLLLCAESGDGRVLGTITLDGNDPEEELAHLRWFVVDDRARGLGIGRALLARSVAFARERGAPGICLYTFAGLDAACHLYEQAGFRLVSESELDRWWAGVRERRYELHF